MFESLRPRHTIVALTFFVPAIAVAQQFRDQTLSPAPARFPTQTEYTNQCSICDVDGDGDLDIAWANGQGFNSQGTALKARIFINSGDGHFTDETDLGIGCPNPPCGPRMPALIAGQTGWFRGVEFGDCDGDGDWDMILAQDFNKRPRLLINDGNGYFADETAARLPNQTLSSARAQFGDVDNDGDLDLIVCNSGATNRFGSGIPKLYLNNGAGVYTDTPANLPATAIAEQQDCIFGDVDNDFDLDVRIGSTGAAQSKLYINNGAGVFTNLAGITNDNNCYSYDFGDINGDGDLDLLGANANGTSPNAELLLGNNAPMATWTNLSAQISPNPTVDDNDSKFIDYDNDGDLDFVIAVIGSTVDRFYNNNGTGTFTQVTGLMTTLASADSSLDVKVADLTGDGRFDIITAQGESGNFQNRIYVNTTGPIDNRAPRFINFEQVPDSANTAGPYVVRAIIYDDMTSDRGFHDKGVVLRYSVDGGPEQTVPMLWSGNNLWRGAIPGLPCGGTASYYATATDWANNVGTSMTQMFTVTAPTLMVGDLDADNDVDMMDQDILVAILIDADQDPAHLCRADLNDDGAINGLEVPVFVAAILGP